MYLLVNRRYSSLIKRRNLIIYSSLISSNLSFRRNENGRFFIFDEMGMSEKFIFDETRKSISVSMERELTSCHTFNFKHQLLSKKEILVYTKSKWKCSFYRSLPLASSCLVYFINDMTSSSFCGDSWNHASNACWSHFISSNDWFARKTSSYIK